MLYLERVNDRVYRAVVVQTDAKMGLMSHAVSASEAFPQISYRTCMVLENISKTNVLDDMFWMALYNMAVNVHTDDISKFYDVLLPFLTRKPLEASLVESEKTYLEYKESESTSKNIYPIAVVHGDSPNDLTQLMFVLLSRACIIFSAVVG